MSLTDRNVGPRLPEELLRSLQDALEKGAAASKGVLRLVLDSARNSLSGQAAVILTPADEHNLQFFQATDDLFLAGGFPTVPIASSIAGFVYLSGQSLALDSARKSSRYYAEIDEQSGFVTVEYLAVPVIHDGTVLGVLTVANRSQPMKNTLFTAGEMELAAQYADLCAFLLVCDSSIRRQIAETGEELLRWFSDSHSGALGGIGRDAFSRSDRATDQLRARAISTLRELPPADLELVHDLAARLSEASAANKT